MGKKQDIDGPAFYHWTIDREILRLLIARRGFTPHSLALEIGMNKTVLYKLLSGEREGTTYPTAEAIAQGLRLDIALFADPAMQWLSGVSA